MSPKLGAADGSACAARYEPVQPGPQAEAAVAEATAGVASTQSTTPTASPMPETLLNMASISRLMLLGTSAFLETYGEHFKPRGLARVRCWNRWPARECQSALTRQAETTL